MKNYGDASCLPKFWVLLGSFLLERLPTSCLGMVWFQIYMSWAVVFCFTHQKDDTHLFFSCPFSSQVWSLTYAWLGYSGLVHSQGLRHFAQHGHFLQGRKHRKVRHLVWLSITWCLWLLRNTIIFSGICDDITACLTH